MLLRLPALAQERRTFVVPFHTASGLILLDMRVNGSPAVMLLDTGANITAFRRAEENDSVKIEIEPYHFVVVKAEPLDKLIGQRSFKLQKDIGLIDGILGQNFFRRFSALRIDYKRSTVEFEQ